MARGKDYYIIPSTLYVKIKTHMIVWMNVFASSESTAYFVSTTVIQYTTVTHRHPHTHRVPRLCQSKTVYVCSEEGSKVNGWLVFKLAVQTPDFNMRQRKPWLPPTLRRCGQQLFCVRKMMQWHKNLCHCFTVC